VSKMSDGTTGLGPN